VFSDQGGQGPDLGESCEAGLALRILEEPRCEQRVDEGATLVESDDEREGGERHLAEPQALEVTARAEVVHESVEPAQVHASLVSPPERKTRVVIVKA
jgi:hypothetical protein